MSGEENRELILANFQAITSIDDIAVCLATLEQFNWDIDSAVMAAMSGTPMSRQDAGNVSFSVEWRSREEKFSLDITTTTIGTLKEMLSNRVGVPKGNFTIIGFPTVEVQMDFRTLSDMGVANNTKLIMVESDAAISSQEPRQSSLFQFRVNVEGLEHELRFPSTRLISEVKQYVERTYNIPITQQRWSGWPPGTSDSLELRDIVLEEPYHRLRVSRQSPSNNVINIDSDDNEFDEVLDSTPSSSSLPPDKRPLMTVGKSSEENVLQFMEAFESRYGAVHPAFHVGTLKSALTTAFNVPADNKRPLIVFLHSDKAFTAHLFCSQVLCCENISQYIDANFVFWAWDLSLKRLEEQVLNECQSIFGLEGRQQVQSYIPDKLPLMIVITKVASSPQVFSVFQGDISPDLLMAQLIDAVENYSQTRSIEKAAEVAQEQRNILREQQELEYLDSLERDREKDHRKLIEEKEKTLQEQTESAKLSSFTDLVPPEPEKHLPSTDITLKLPNGERLSRRFLHDTKLKILLYFMGSKGFAPSDYTLVQNFPKRTFDEDEMELTLEDLGLLRREILYVEEKD